MYELIIIGAGPAGLTAALYAGRFRLKTLLLEKMVVGGRMLMSERIENFPGFPEGVSTQELTSRMEEQIKPLDIKIEQEEIFGIDCGSKTIKAGENSYQAGAIIIATGASPRKLGVPGEEKFIGKGVSYCATCDAPLYKEKEVVVVGGGDAVAEEALYLARFAKKVTIIHRRDQMRASQILQERIKENNKINFLLGNVVAEICGSQKVESLKVKNVATSQEGDLYCNGVFIFIGSDPETGFLKDRLKLDEKGFIITDEKMAASEEGIFACGDCRRKTLYQVVTACGDGAVAADSAYAYISAKSK